MDKKQIIGITGAVVIAVVAVTGITMLMSRKKVDKSTFNNVSSTMYQEVTQEQTLLEKEENTKQEETQIQTLSEKEKLLNSLAEYKKAYCEFIKDPQIFKNSAESDSVDMYYRPIEMYLFDMDLDSLPELVIEMEALSELNPSGVGNITYIYKYNENNEKVELIKSMKSTQGIYDNKYICEYEGALAVESIKDNYYQIGNLDKKYVYQYIESIGECRLVAINNDESKVLNKSVTEAFEKNIKNAKTDVNSQSYKYENIAYDSDINQKVYVGSKYIKNGSDINQEDVDAYNEALILLNLEELQESINQYEIKEGRSSDFFENLMEDYNDEQDIRIPDDMNSSGQAAEVTGSNVNVRKGPGTQYDAISKVTIGDTFEIYGEENGWYYGKLQDNTWGWIIQDYIQM